LVGDWSGNVFISAADGGWRNWSGVDVRFDDENTLRYIDSVSKLTGEPPHKAHYKFAPQLVYLDKVVKNSFGDVTERSKVPVYSFDLQLSGGLLKEHFRYMKFDSDNSITLYSDSVVATGQVYLFSPGSQSYMELARQM
jgi:hypothetical protein